MEDVGRRVCVTGAGGFVGSWLVKLLLSKGYTVHGTVRDPSDDKNAHLKKLERATENLKLLKADLLDYNALATAVAGCEGVFHVASPVTIAKVPDPEAEIVTPAVTGTLNTLKACSEAKVKRVVVVSSTAAVVINPNWLKDTIFDEDHWSDKEYCRTTEGWYSLSKTQAECEALDYGKKHGLDVVTVCPCWVIGPLLQSTVNTSSSFLLNILKAGRESVDNRVRHVVDVRDVAEALLLVYEKPETSGRYICASYKISVHGMVEILKSTYPNYNYPNEYIEVEEDGQLTSEKLKLLGWKCRTLKESFIDSVECYREAGLLEKI